MDPRRPKSQNGPCAQVLRISKSLRPQRSGRAAVRASSLRIALEETLTPAPSIRSTRNVRHALLIAGTLCLQPLAQAEVFKCVAPSGSIGYQSSPCASGLSRPLRIRDSGGAAEAPARMDSATASATASAAAVSAITWPRAIGVPPEVVGSDHFQRRVNAALALLRARDPDSYEIVARYVGRILEANRSGMRAYEDPPTYRMTDKEASTSVEWAAAVIAHDSYHSKLYWDFRGSRPTHVPPRIWGGRDAEVICMRHQIAVMQRIGASSAELAWARSQADGHYVEDGDYNDHDHDAH